MVVASAMWVFDRASGLARRRPLWGPPASLSIPSQVSARAKCVRPSDRLLGLVEAAPEGVLADRAEVDEVEQVVATACFAAGSGRAMTAERMARHLCARDFPVDVQIADVELEASALDVGGAPRID